MTPRRTALVGLACAGALAAAPARGGLVEGPLRDALAARAPGEEIAILVSLAGTPALPAARGRSRAERARSLVAALRERGRAARPLEARLAALGARRVRTLWAVGAVAARVPAGAIEALARDPAVERVRLDAAVLAPEVPPGTRRALAAEGAGDPAPEWNLALVGAPALWAAGVRGTGVVVATMDTGVDATHPDLAERWRAGPGGWLDPHGEHAAPHDASGHGTQVTGILVGGARGGTAIGVAPDARWIAVKLYDDQGRATFADLHEAFQWLLDPDGDPATDDAPDVVNASWGLLQAPEPCVDEFDADLRVLRAAGIAVVFAAGNAGPAPGGESPANNASAFAAGAVDGESEVAPFSARGPSACDGRIFPDVVAPGVGIRTADLSFGGPAAYASVTGTSYSAPHVAGAMALLASAFPGATPDELEAALLASAVDVAAPGPDDDSGAGVVDVRAAHRALWWRRLVDAVGLSGGGGCSSGGGAALLAAAGALAALARARRGRSVRGARRRPHRGARTRRPAR